jgi:hypothetical protein
LNPLELEPLDLDFEIKSPTKKLNKERVLAKAVLMHRDATPNSKKRYKKALKGLAGKSPMWCNTVEAQDSQGLAPSLSMLNHTMAYCLMTMMKISSVVSRATTELYYQT